MTSFTNGATTDHADDQAVAGLTAAKQELYRAELALHDARLTYVDEWIKAASDHLQRACTEYERQLAS